jgi:hypothetical protein
LTGISANAVFANILAVAQRFSALIGLVPVITQGIKEIEVSMPAGGTALEAAFAVEQSLADTFNQIWPAVKTAVELVVAAKFHIDDRFAPKTTSPL